MSVDHIVKLTASYGTVIFFYGLCYVGGRFLWWILKASIAELRSRRSMFHMLFAFLIFALSGGFLITILGVSWFPLYELFTGSEVSKVAGDIGVILLCCSAVYAYLYGRFFFWGDELMMFCGQDAFGGGIFEGLFFVSIIYLLCSITVILRPELSPFVATR